MAIQTLHGVCFVFFWIAIVEHAQRIASTSTLATAQSLVSTCYYVLGAGVGSLLWGLEVRVSGDPGSPAGGVNSGSTAAKAIRSGGPQHKGQQG